MSAGTMQVESGEGRARRYRDLSAAALTVLTVIFAAVWFFPLYWAVVTSLKAEHDVVRPGINLIPSTRHLPATSTTSSIPTSCAGT